MGAIENMRLEGFIGVKKLVLGMFLEEYMIDGMPWGQSGAI